MLLYALHSDPVFLLPWLSFLPSLSSSSFEVFSLILYLLESDQCSVSYALNFCS